MQDNPLCSPAEFQGWVDNPMTQAFRQYLKDYRDQLSAMWAEGQPLSPKDQAWAEMAGDLASLSCDDVRAFYGIKEGESE